MISNNSNLENQGSPTCDGSTCDRDRYRQLNAAFCGYNIFFGEPYALNSGVDPGIKQKIFEPAQPGPDGRIELQGVTVFDHQSCESKFKTEIIKSETDFKSTLRKRTSLGGGIEVGALGVNADLIFNYTKLVKEVRNFFAKERGAIAMTTARCTTSSLAVNFFNMPKFSTGFRTALELLAEVSDSSPSKQRYLFKHFIDAYGTHYMSKVEMGAELLDTKFLMKRATDEYTEDLLDKCFRFGASLRVCRKAGVEAGIGGRFQNCKYLLETSNNKNSDYVKSSSWVVRGGVPADPTKIKDWAKSKFKPVPLKMELKSINNLLEKHILKAQGLTIDAEKLKTWFIPLFSKYCEMMGFACRTGCWFGDMCKMHEKCIVTDAATQAFKCVGK